MDRNAAVFLTPLWLTACLAFSVDAYAGGTNRQSDGAGKEKDNVQEMVADHLRTCAPRYRELNARIARAGVGFAGYHPVPGYPWVRSNRFLASYVGDFESDLGLTSWVYQLRDNEGFALRIELRNLGMPPVQRARVLNDLRLCAVWLSTAAIFDPEQRDDFLYAAQLPMRQNPRDSAPLSAAEQREAAQQIRADFGTDVDTVRAAAAVTQWRPKLPANAKSLEEVLTVMRTNPRDKLGRMGLIQDDWAALAAYYAPVWLVDTASNADAPGAPRWGAHGPYIDRGEPVVHWQAAFARINERCLVQLHYFLWFGESAGASNPRPADGLIWRVTLNQQLYPLVYESLNMDGTGHLWFPVADMATRHESGALVPQGKVGKGQAVVRVEAGSHDVYRVTTGSDYEIDAQRSYRLRRYEHLFTLATPRGGTQSWFDAEGYVVGSHNRPGPGMRQLRRISLAPREPWFFDDPALLAHIFKTPLKVASRESAERYSRQQGVVAPVE